jgi:hypothetical protein
VITADKLRRLPGKNYFKQYLLFPAKGNSSAISLIVTTGLAGMTTTYLWWIFWTKPVIQAASSRYSGLVLWQSSNPYTNGRMSFWSAWATTTRGQKAKAARQVGRAWTGKPVARFSEVCCLRERSAIKCFGVIVIKAQFGTGYFSPTIKTGFEKVIASN